MSDTANEAAGRELERQMGAAAHAGERRMADTSKADTSRTAERLRDEAVAASIAAAEHRREAERVRAMYEDVRDQLVEATAAYDELRREHEQVERSERAVRRVVLRAAIDGERVVPIDDVRHALDTGEAP